jgi:hypothetical protein
MTTLSKLLFQEKGHGLRKKKRHAQQSMKKKRETFGHMKVQVLKKRDSPCPKKEN